MAYSTRTISLISSISLLLMAVLAGFAFEQVFKPLFSSSDPKELYEAMLGQLSQVRLGIAAWVGIFILDIIVSIGFYLLFKSEYPRLSIWSAIFRLAYTVMLGTGIVSVIFAVLAIQKNDPVLVPELYQAVFNWTMRFESLWSKGLIIFGAHLMLLGWMMRKSSWGLKTLSVFLVLGGIGYTIVHAGFAFFPDQKSIFQTIESIFLLPMIVGEMGFAIWLLIHGGKSPLTVHKNSLSDSAQ